MSHSVGDCEITASNGKKLVIRSDTSSVRTIDVSTYGRIFKISGGAELTLEHIVLKNGNADTGGAVYVEDGTLTLTGETVITPSTGADINTPGKNDVYLANGTSIKVDSTLTTTEPIVARITPNYTDGNTVLTGSPASVSTNYTKFSVTQPVFATNLWKIKSDGTLKAIPTIINSGSGAWQRLKEAVQVLPEGSTITVNGKIEATKDGSGETANWGEISIEKNLTIKGNNKITDILDAHELSRIFNIDGGKTLTLENLTLKNGKKEGAIGGCILVFSGKVELTDCIIENCTAGDGGAIGVKGEA